MSKITKTARSAVDFIRGRVGARLLLILCCFMCFTAFTDNIGAIDITADGETQTIITLRNDPVEIISRAGLALETEDQLVVVKDEDNSGVGAIEVLRGVQVTVIDAGAGTTFEIAANSTVADALAKANVQQPDSDDAMNCTLSDTVYDYMEIVIDRVVYEERAANQVIEYKTVKHETSELLKGETRVAVKGANGEKRIVTQYKWVNGQLESQNVISETVIKEAVNEIVDVGTAVPITTTKPTTAVNYNGGSSKEDSAGTFVDASGRTVSYKKVLTGTGTAYNEPAGSKTATGRPVQVGLVAVDPRVIPYGTNLYIVSADGKIVYGYALAADTGSALRNGDALVDLFYDSESQCLAFGRRDVIVYILED